MSKAIAPSPWAIRAFWLKSQLPLITTRALPITEDALIPELSHSREEVIFTNWYSIWKSPLTLTVRQCLERCQNQKSCKIEKLTAEFSDCASGVQEWLWTMQNSLSVSPFEICEIASWPFIYWERNSTPLIHYIWKISEPSPALTVKCYPCSTHLRLIEYLVINHSHWAKGQIQINTKYGIKITLCSELFISAIIYFLWRVLQAFAHTDAFGELRTTIFFPQLMDLVHHFSISKQTKTKPINAYIICVEIYNLLDDTINLLMLIGLVYATASY